MATRPSAQIPEDSSSRQRTRPQPIPTALKANAGEDSDARLIARTAERFSELIYDWNAHAHAQAIPVRPLVLDETLRDGLQSPSANDPPVEAKRDLLHLMAGLGIHCAAVGMPATRQRQYDDSLALATEVASARLPIAVLCTARTLPEDVVPIIEISQRAGVPIEVGMFVGSSPIRHYAEGWSLDDVLRRTEESITYAVRHDLSVMYVTEDTTRAHPDSLRKLYETAVRCGASRLCIADTVGHATPVGASAVVHFVRDVLVGMDVELPIDWHGHRDRGMEIANCMAAWRAGVERCHGTALGIGERSGNAPLELLLVNLRLSGWGGHGDLSCLPRYVSMAAAALGFTVPVHHPIVGKDAFRTATGIHAAAVLKAQSKGEPWLADRVYSSVPAELVGREQVLEIGPLSGEASVYHFLSERGLPTDASTLAGILKVAKCSDRVLSEEDVLGLFPRGGKPPAKAHGVPKGSDAGRSSSKPSRGQK